MPGDRRVVVGVDEVDVIRGPANHEDPDNSGKHLHKLKQFILHSLIFI